MATTLPAAATPPVGSPVRARGILALASPAPEGWEAGGVQVPMLCADPIVRDGCVTMGDVPKRPTITTFPPFLIRQGSECSTISADAREQEARDGLSQTTDFALGLTLRTGEASGGPSLDDAVDVGDFGDVIGAVSAIERAASLAGRGQEYVLHAAPSAAAYLVDAGLIDEGGRSPSGAVWIVSAGYEDGTDLRIWATGKVWAGAGAITVDQQVGRRTNQREAWAARAGIVGFNTCINLTATFAPNAAGGGTVDPEARAAIETLQGQVVALQNEKASHSHTHDAGDVNAGTFSTARIPSLSIGKITGLQAALDGKVTAVQAGTGIAVDATNPQTPIVAIA